MERYNVLFSGKILSDQDMAEVQPRVGALLRVDQAKLAALFSGRTVTLKRSADEQTAGRIRAAMRKAGAIVQVIPVETVSAPGAALPPGDSRAVPPSAASVPRPGAIPSALADFDLSDCQVPVRATQIPDISQLQADSDYQALDTSALPPAANIDTGQLHADEDYDALDTSPRPPPPDIDTSQLQADEDYDALDASPPPPRADIDTGQMDLESSDLSDCSRPSEPKPIPDISHIRLDD